MKKEIAVIKIEAPELSAIEKSKAESIKKTFEPMVVMLSGFEGQYDDIIAESTNGITPELAAKAKRCRLDIGKVRIETGKLKDKQKEYIKLEDKAIMGVHNILVWAVAEKEDKLKEIENHAEIEEKKRLDKLQLDRAEILAPYVEDAYERDLAKFAEDEFEALLSMKKKALEDKIQAEKQAELDRLRVIEAEQQKQLLIEAENAKLKAAAIEVERLNKIEADKRAKEEADRLKAEEQRFKEESIERAKRDELAQVEKSKHEAELKRQREATEKIQREAKEKADKLQAEIDDKLQAERDAKLKDEANKQSELNKGDAEKVKDLIADLNAIKTKYEFKSVVNQKMYADVCALIDKVTGHINK